MAHGLNRLRRLRSMTREELAHRLHAALRTEIERLRFHVGAFDASTGLLAGKTSPRANRESLKSYLENTAARRFLLPASSDKRQCLREFIEENCPAWKDSAVEEAERLCAHRIELLGFGEVSLGDEIDWHRDPVTGYR